MLKRGVVEMHAAAVALRAALAALRDALPRLAAAPSDAAAAGSAPPLAGAGWGEVERRVGELWEGLEAVLEAEARCRHGMSSKRGG